VGEIIGGVALLAAGCVVWLARHRLAERELPGTGGGRGRAFTTGATLMAVELPTAFPYFAAIAVIAGLDRSVLVELLLVALFNVVFLAPLLLIAALVHFSSGIRTEAIRSAAGWLNGHWPAIFAWVLWVAGFVLVVLGAVRLDRQ
jgi:cytochrome c biogenesis protein CcdA